MKILIVRFSAIGDCLMDAWAVSALRRAEPDWTLDWVLESRCAPVIDDERLVNRRVEVPRKRADGTKARGVALQSLRMYAGLRRERYHVGIDLQGHAKTALALRLAAPRRRYLARIKDPFAGRMGTLLTTKAIHHVEVAAEVLTAATQTRLDLGQRPILPPVPLRDGRLATIAVSAGRPERALNPAAITEVARGLTARGYVVELLGGPNDRAPEDLGGATDRVGRMSLRETLSRVAESGLLVAGDTGAGHMAAAAGTPVVSVFGPSPSAWTRPYTDALELIEGGERTDSVTGETILQAVDRLRVREVHA